MEKALSYTKMILPFLSTVICHFTDKKHQHDDDDSGMGPSTFTDTKTTTVSEVSYILLLSRNRCLVYTLLLCTRIVWTRSLKNWTMN